MAALATAKRIEMWPLGRLVPYERNARTHSDEQVAQIVASIQEFGFTNPLLVDGSDGIIAGHGRLMAARSLGLAEVPVIVLDHLSPEQRRAYVLADNQLALNAGWDMEVLALEIGELGELGFDLSLLGFSDEQLAELSPEVEELPPGEQGDPDDVPEPPTDPITKPGDLWILGNHRLLCGDSTDVLAVERLMDGKKAELLLTDPPYGIGACSHQGSKKNGWKQYGNKGWDASIPSDDWIATALTIASEKIIWGGNYFADKLPASQCWLVWDKGQRDFSLADGELAWTSFDKALRIKTISRASALKDGKVHPTQKSVELFEWCLSFADGLVLDLFGGSGTTLIACEKTSRHCRMMELDPAYCDVIVKRWQQFTGKTATLEATGEPFPAEQ